MCAKISTSDTLAGGYNAAARIEQIRLSLQKSFAEIQKENIHHKYIKSGSSGNSSRSSSGGWFSSIGYGGGGGDRNKRSQDILTMRLSGTEDEINELAIKVKAFKGPHFTKVYRTLQGDCTKLQTELDAIDVSGREDIRQERRRLLNRINQLAKDLQKETHEDGNLCPECEIKE